MTPVGLPSLIAADRTINKAAMSARLAATGIARVGGLEQRVQILLKFYSRGVASFGSPLKALQQDLFERLRDVGAQTAGRFWLGLENGGHDLQAVCPLNGLRPHSIS